MGILIKASLAILLWLAVFEQHLIRPLAALPFTEVASALTMPDWVLLGLAFVAVWVVNRMIDNYLFPRGTLETWRRR